SYIIWLNEIVLNSYSVQIRVDATKIIPIDGIAARRAHDWLEHQQHEDGSWQSITAYSDRQQNLGLTAFVTRVLSRPGSQGVSNPSRLPIQKRRNCVADALSYLHDQH